MPTIQLDSDLLEHQKQSTLADLAEIRRYAISISDQTLRAIMTTNLYLLDGKIQGIGGTEKF